MSKKRYIPKRKKRKVLSPKEQVLDNMKNCVGEEKFIKLAEGVSGEKEVRNLYRRAWDFKCNPKVFGIVCEVLMKKKKSFG